MRAAHPLLPTTPSQIPVQPQRGRGPALSVPPSSRSWLRRASARVTVVRCAPKVDAICSCVIPA